MGLATTTGMLLIVAVSLLTPMVPGGPIETRSFATLPRAVFWGFNAFLIMLGLGSIVIAVLVLGGGTWAYGIALGLGAGYVAVFGLDLAGVFPRSKDPLPPTLLLLEVLDLAIGAALCIAALQGLLS